jgi:hypothetical protein
MEDKSKDKKRISRRGMFSLLGSSLLIPMLGFGNTIPNENEVGNDDEYQTLLKPDGTTVRVKASTLKKSKVVKKNVSNRSFLSWLGKKL